MCWPSGGIGAVRGAAAKTEQRASPTSRSISMAARIDDQHDRPAGDPGEFGRRTGFAIRARAVEQPHHAFAENDVGGGFELGDEYGKGSRPHRPDVEVHTGLAGGLRMKARVDEI